MQERLKQIIEQKGLTAERFASLIGVNASTISHILNGRNKPGFDIIYNITKTFPDINIGWLITGEGSMNAVNSNSSIPRTSPEEPTLFDMPASTLPFSAGKTANSVSSSSDSGRKLKRIILFFDDGSFEDYASR